MSSKVSTAGIKLNKKGGLLDSCPRRFETKDAEELDWDDDVKTHPPVAKRTPEHEKVEFNN
jgi:hypothetical protein